jgi:sugar lactone lactonase YvrE
MIYKRFINIAGNRKLFFLILGLIVITISCDNKLSTSPVEPEPQNGKIIFESNPPGFLVFINGRNSGSITPDSLTFLDAGNYDITLKKKYYKDSVFTLQLNQDERKNLFIDYINNLSMYGRINLFSIPAGASIKLFDSLLTSTTPDTIEHLLPGEYIITLSYPQHRSTTFNTVVESGKMNLYSNILQDTSEWVDFQVFNSGIASNYLKTLAVDHNNYKWIGTLDKGLQKFDGFNFVTFNTSNSNIPSNRINVIRVDNNNNIWVGTNNGIGIFNGASWTNYDKNNSGLTSNDILSIDFDNLGNTWIGVSSGLYKFDGTNWTRYNDADYNLWTNDLKVASDNSIWLATNSGIIKFKDEIITYFLDSIYLYPTNIVSAIEIDQLGNVWSCHQNILGSRNGVSVFDGSQFNNTYYGSSTNSLNDIFIDSNNRKWISTTEGLVLVKQDGNTIIFKKSTSLISSDAVTSCFIDLNGDLWITTNGGGLNKFKIQ